MNPDKAYDLLHQIAHMNLDPGYLPPTGHCTFMLVQIAEEPRDGLHFSTAIVDPAMPDKGGAEEYLRLLPAQRIALECGRILHNVSDAVAAVAKHGPFDKDLNEKASHDKNRLVTLLRFMSRVGAYKALDPEKFS